MPGRSRFVALVVGVSLVFSLAAAAQSRRTPKFRVWMPTQPTAAAIVAGTTSQVTVRHWSSSFVFNNKTYHYSMVGANPANGSSDTTVSTEIQPINFIFSNGKEIKAGGVVTPLIDSPIFQKASLPDGYGQLTDVEQRANFHSIIAANKETYYIHLGQPALLSTITVKVPSGSGETQTVANGTTIGLIDYNFLQSVVGGILSSRNFNPTTLPILLAGNVFAYDMMPDNCCIVGFHGADAVHAGQLVTFVFTAYPSPGVFSGNFEDITAVSHEVAEWMNDPFTNDFVPP